MIVLSVLTALALEQVVVAAHDASAARENKARIDAEIASFADDLGQAVAANEARLKSVNAALAVLQGKLRAGTPAKAELQKLAADVVDQLGIRIPTNERDAWDAAIADQSVRNLRTADLRRYARIYAEESTTAQETQLLLSGDYVRSLSDANLAVGIGQVDGEKFAETLTLDALTGREILNHQKRLLRLIEGDSHAAPGGF